MNGIRAICLRHRTLSPPLDGIRIALACGTNSSFLEVGRFGKRVSGSTPPLDLTLFLVTLMPDNRFSINGENRRVHGDFVEPTGCGTGTIWRGRRHFAAL
ncbi:hypothetical protein FRC08_000484 [Ceratobasidium sp. 394]|nr:hypothetical protein FRC08_000484 [Ceratobasidium sp. 394]